MGPTGTVNDKPRGPMRLALSFGLGHLGIDDSKTSCEMCTHDTPVLAVHLSLAYEFIPRIAIGPQVQVHYGFAEGLPGGDERIRQFGLFAAVRLVPLPRVVATGGLGFLYADYAWQTRDNFLGGSTGHSQEIGSGPATLLAGRINLLENVRRTDFGIEGRLILAKLGDVGATTSFSVDAVFGY